MSEYNSKKKVSVKLAIGISILVIAIIISYLLGFIGDPLFFLLFPLAFIALLFIGLLYIIAQKNISVTLACTLLFLLGGLGINRYFFPSLFHPISIAGNIGFSIFILFLGWTLAKPHPRRRLSIGIPVFIAFNIFLIAVSSLNIEEQTDTESNSLDALKSLPYLTWVSVTENIDQKGVIQYEQTLAFPGINIYNPSHLSEAYLLNMSGNIVHTWSKKGGRWHHIEMDKNGDLFVIVKDEVLFRLDWNSQVEWITEVRGHHDIAVAENGDIYIVARKDEVVFYHGIPIPILNDYIVILSQDGKIKKELSLFKIIQNENPFQGKFFTTYYDILSYYSVIELVKARIKRGYIYRNTTPPDIMHTNTVEIIDRDIPNVCKKGDLLISVRNLDLIGIVNVEQEKLIWQWGPGDISRQHHPTLLENGNILIFDNGVYKNRSRIVELNPVSKEIVWEYTSEPPEKFFSGSRGSNQRFPNGNTLITESDKGHVFEITPNGEIVWEFYTPAVIKDKNKRASIYRMMRIVDLEKYPRLKELE